MGFKEWRRSEKPKATAETRNARLTELGGKGAYVRKIGMTSTVYQIENVFSHGWVQLKVIRSTNRVLQYQSGKVIAQFVSPHELEHAEPPTE